MGQRGVLRTLEGNLLAFFCPGCEEAHHVAVEPSKHAWGFNGNYDAPTFTPSVLVQGYYRLTEDEYNRLVAGEKIEPRPRRCHSFVRDGRIEFLSDCSHDKAGQTIALEAF